LPFMKAMGKIVVWRAVAIVDVAKGFLKVDSGITQI
jgi:hypothetical protein